jgi:UDP-4-amino-4,6-dideoxy-N-acetyl-beta-L-altrosamine N-acetyltransferase
MFVTQDIGEAEHQRWFASIDADPRRHVLILEIDEQDSGFVNIGPVNGGGIADWGFYVAPGMAKGSGRILGKLALEFAFDELRLHKLCGEVLEMNEASIRFHERWGFRREGEFVDQHFDGGSYRKVIRFGLLAQDWLDRDDGTSND